MTPGSSVCESRGGRILASVEVEMEREARGYMEQLLEVSISFFFSLPHPPRSVILPPSLHLSILLTCYLLPHLFDCSLNFFHYYQEITPDKAAGLRMVDKELVDREGGLRAVREEVERERRTQDAMLKDARSFQVLIKLTSLS